MRWTAAGALGTATNSNPLVTVREMTADDIDAVVQVHTRAFPEYLLTHMGSRYLRHYYSTFALDSKHYALVAEIDGRVVGFVAGTAETGQLEARVYRPSIVTALTVAARFVTDPVLRKHLLSKRTHIKRTFARPPVSTSSRPAVRARQARLLSIGVSPDLQRMGVAQALVNAFNKRLHADGIAAVGLSVRHDNTSGIAFYDRTGWDRDNSDKNGIYYVRSTAS
ncbi:MAG: GNAT family N-acetyltransferase [Candidatus Eremiobacteraeota bacterium]|nr:GNAT family N-acetyltransferase [Candidatus Eremiobacteraeota bacterium]